jgi:serine phosphatase RsbU (regulator of sigma subunit)/Tfp pilus assembly protein PilF
MIPATRSYFLLSFFSLLCTFNLLAEGDPYVDSLESRLKDKLHDTVRAQIYIDLAEYIIEESGWVPYNDKAFELADSRIKSTTGNERKFFLRIKANAVGNQGYYYDDHGDIQKSIEKYFESLRLYDEAGDQAGKATILSNLGIIYTDRKDYEEALDYLDQALKLKLKYEPSDVSKNYINIGVALERIGDSLDALNHYKKALKAARDVNDLIDMSTATNNIGSWYFHKKDYPRAASYLKEAVDLCFEAGDDAGAAWSLANLGNCYRSMEKFDSAYYYLSEAERISEKYGYPELRQTVYEKFYGHYSVLNDHKKALYYLELAEQMEDSVENVGAQKEAIRQKMAYDHDLEKATLKLQREEEQKRETQRFYFILGVSLLTGLFGIFIYRRLQITKRQKNVIETQKAEVEGQKLIIEEKNTEILDSINYAKRLQEAILPDQDVYEKNFADSFLFYQPKDIVAGDFYWFHQTDKYMYFAVADCTGHGVPGSLVSVVCANGLEHSILSKEDISTGELLDRTTEYVIERFENEGTDVKDGMDIALCRISRSKEKLQFSGAFNPCWIIRDKELIEYKGDRRPVGKHITDDPFTTNEIVLKNSDWLYLITDGFQDQFGGEKGKKYKTANLKRFLATNHGLIGEVQLSLLQAELLDWRGEIEQIDDICILGVKI